MLALLLQRLPSIHATCSAMTFGRQRAVEEKKRPSSEGRACLASEKFVPIGSKLCQEHFILKCSASSCLILALWGVPKPHSRHVQSLNPKPSTATHLLFRKTLLGKGSLGRPYSEKALDQIPK